MDKFIAIFATALGLIYSDLSVHDLWHNLVLPLLAIFGLAYLFWFKGFLILTTGVMAYYFMDVDSESFLLALMLPLTLGGSIISFVWWGVFHFDLHMDGSDGSAADDCGGGSD